MSKITTQSYFIKRLKDSGYYVWKMFDKYPESDSRHWTILIDPRVSCVWCTCHINHPDFYNQSAFEFYDGNRFVLGVTKIATESMEVILEYLNGLNIINKFEYE